MKFFETFLLSFLFYFSLSFYRGKITKRNILFNFSYGFVFLSIFVNFLLFFHILNLYLIFFILILFFIFSAYNLCKNFKFDYRFLPFLAFLFLLFFISAVPPFYKDELVYHLEIPKLYWLNGGFCQFKRNFYSYFPQGIENVYLIFLSRKFFFPEIPRFIHSIFFFNTVILLSIIFKNLKYRTIFLLFFISTPTLFIVSTYGYIDSAIMFFFMMGVFIFLEGREYEKILFFAVVLLGIKYTSIFYFFLLFLLFLYGIKDEGNKISLRDKKWYILIFSIFFSLPFYVKNVILTKNPFFPFFYNIFGSKNPYWNEELYRSFMGFLKNYGVKLPSILKFLSIFYASFNLKFESPLYFDGVIGLIGILWLPSILYFKKFSKKERFILLIAAFGVLFWSYSVREVRFLFFLIPLFTLLIFYSFKFFPPYLKKGFLFFLLFLSIFNFYQVFKFFRAISIKNAVFFNEKREKFLSENVDMYRVSKFLNENTPEVSKIFMVESSNENFYLNRKYISDYIVTDYTFYNLIKSSKRVIDVVVYFKRLRVNYILMRRNWIFSPIFNTGIESKRNLLRSFYLKYLRKIYEDKNYQVYKISY